jgi:peptide subunit release factor 1 (eRF1)
MATQLSFDASPRAGFEELLRSLARYHFAPHRALSLYLDTAWRDEQQRERVFVTVRDRVRQLRAAAAGDPSLDADLDALLEFTTERVKQHADVGLRGVARFLCSAAGLDVTVRSFAPLPTLLASGPLLFLRPLVALPLERTLVALADARSVRIHEIGAGRLDERAVLDEPTPSHHARGGFSQLKLAHQRARKVDELHRDAADALARLFDDGRVGRVFVGGRDGAAKNLLKRLPPRVAARAIAIDEIDTHDAAAHELAVIERALAELTLADDTRTVEQATTLAASGGRGAVGVEAVVAALNQARPFHVLVADRLEQRASVCAACGLIALDDGAVCAACGGARLAVDATEAIARAALALSARVDVVANGALDGAGGAAALLRF